VGSQPKMTSPSPLLRVKNLACVYGEFIIYGDFPRPHSPRTGENTLISDISFDLNEGDCLVIVGASGSG
jgi:ABC-type glutathione transport system ATPase component